MKKTIRRINFAFPRLFQVNLVILIIMMIFLLTSCNSSTSLSGREYVSDNLLLQIKMTFEKDQVIVEYLDKAVLQNTQWIRIIQLFRRILMVNGWKVCPKDDTIDTWDLLYLR
jgi:hypothetical protein